MMVRSRFRFRQWLAACASALCIGLLSGSMGGASVLYAQPDVTPHHTFAARQGLTDAPIRALAQSPDRRLWLGTTTGVTVYNGTTFRSLSLPDSIGSRSVTALSAQPDGSVWAAPRGAGVLRLSPHSVRASMLPGVRVHRIVRQGRRLLFVASDAVWILGPDDDRPQRHPFRYDIRPPARVSAFPHSGTGAMDADVTPDGTLWILDGHRGPGRVHADGSVTFFEVPRAETGPRWWEMRSTPSGHLLLSRDDTLYRFAPARRRLDTLRTGLSGPIYVNRAQGTLIASWERHVATYDAQHDTLRMVFRTQPGLPALAPQAALRDREGSLWIGTRTGLTQLPHPAVRHVRAVDGTPLVYPGHWMPHGAALWVQTWGSGLVQMRPQRAVATPDGRSHWSQKIVGHDGHRHARSDDAWYRLEAASGWTRVREAPHAVRGVVGPEGVGYFWHDDGLYRHPPDPEATPVRLVGWDPATRDRNMVAMTRDTMLLVRHGGLLLRRRRTDGYPLDTLARFPEFARSEGRYMMADATGTLWLAFYRDGLVRIRPRPPTGGRALVERVLHRPMNDVALVGDRLVLASTDEGLFLLDRATGRLRRHFTEADGLRTNAVTSAWLGSDTLYVAHPRGLTLLPRRMLADRPQPPPTLLTALEVNLDERPLERDSVLAAHERSVGFSYAGMSLVRAHALRYEYRLLPQDTTWRSTQRTFTRYVNLDPGRYRFQVRARLASAGPGPPATYTFVVPAYVYERWSFWLLGSVLALGAVGAGVWWRGHRARRQRRRLERAVARRTQELVDAKQTTEAQARRLQKLDDAKNQFFAHISHEFRTPLTLILAPIRDALHQSDADPLPLPRRHARHILHNATRLQRLIRDLLDLATLEAGSPPPDRRRGDLGRVVRRVSEGFAPFAEHEQIALHIDTPNDPLDAAFDPEMVETVLGNLLSNALKFTPSGGTVRVQLTATDDTARLSVADTGPGIPPDMHERIFEQFAHIDPPDAASHDGFGLGLALSRAQIEQHGGSITVESTPGDGATFTVCLPRGRDLDAPPLDASASQESPSPRALASHRAVSSPDASAEGESPAEAAPDADPAASRATILVVEDNAEMRTYLRDVLSASWNVETAADGEAGWDAVHEHRPDCVVSDVMLPQLDGFALCERIKSDPECASIPVLLLTARTSDDDTLTGLGHGADAYLTKPFDTRELRQRVANHLEARAHLQAQYQQEVRIEPTGDVAHADDVPFLETVLRTIRTHLDDPDFTVDHLADAVALSRRQLSRRLKDTIGETPGAFIRTQRIEHAQSLLADDPDTIAKVAYRVGFRSASHFSKIFREHTGCSPSEYRAQNAPSRQ